ncbi:MAG TPA: hypothetical protein VFH47_02175 [Candidatus Thermoplasmatota archaeon]|nr:hypothetical protein [Candidatus Thermoplasmatota archaeon]
MPSHARRAALAFLGVGLMLAAAAPAAAHTTYVTEDGRYRIVVGNLDEPVTTHVKTGLDLMIQLDDEARTPVTVNPGNLTATLHAPDNMTTLQLPLQAQYGRPGAYTFNEPYVLTRPGQYTLHLVGDIHGTAVDARIPVAGPVGDMAEVTFPDRNAPSTLRLQQENAALREQVDALAARVIALEHAGHDSHEEDAPVPAGVLVAGLLTAMAVALRRRTSDA